MLVHLFALFLEDKPPSFPVLPEDKANLIWDKQFLKKPKVGELFPYAVRVRLYGR